MSGIPSQSLRVQGDTTLSDVQRFSGGLRADDNVRAKKVDGGWEIFSRPTRGGGLLRQALDTLKGPWQRHQVSQALRHVVGNHERLTGHQASNILAHALTKPFGPDLKAAVLNLTSGADNTRDVAEDTSIDEIFTTAPGPERFNLGSGEVMAAIMEVAGKLNAGTDPETLTTKLGDAVAAGFEASKPSAEERKDFGTSNPTAARRELEGLLMDLADGEPPIPGLSQMVTKLVSDVFNHAAAATQANHFIDDNNFIHDGERYTSANPEPIGKGANGVVRDFVRVSDGVHVAVKVGIPPDDASRANMTPVDLVNRSWHQLNGALHEVALHQRVQGEGHPNITHMVGTVRHPGGGLAIVLEMAPHGTMKGFGEKMERAVKAGVITREEALLGDRAATRDILHGVAHSHANGMMNQDIKDENCLIGPDGTVKIADNGGARSIENYDNENVGSYTESFLSPDAASAPETKLRTAKAVGLRPETGPIETTAIPSTEDGSVPETRKLRVSVDQNPMRLAVKTTIDRLMPGLADAEKATLLRSFLANTTRDIVDLSTDAAKRDIYAAGLATRTLLYKKGEETMRFGFSERDPSAQMLADLKGLVDGMSRPDVATRFAPSDAIANKAVTLTDDELTAGRGVLVKVSNWSKAEANRISRPITPPVFRTSVQLS